jgi:AcrR family transcriptional regulator
MENVQSRPDRRSVRTKKAIVKALTTLMIEKDISKITIKEISDLADINRKTFYAHYGSVYEILDELENDIIESLTDAVETIDFSNGSYNPYAFYEKITASAYDNFDIYEHLMKSTAHSHLLAKIKAAVKERIVDDLYGAFGLDKVMLSYMVEFISAGTISVYEQWFNSDRSIKLEELSKLIGDLEVGLLSKLLVTRK